MSDDLNLSAFDSQCDSCGALYEVEPPEECELCGCDVFHPVEDLAW